MAVRCDGFGRLSGSFQFAPRLTVVTGPNEAGKSTLYELLFRILYGFNRSERTRRRDGRPSPWEARRPWQSGRKYGALAEISDREGRTLRVEWNFEKPELRVFDAHTGADLSNRFRAKGREVALGQVLLGLGPEEFRQVCCLGQGDVERPSDDAAAQLAERLRALVESGREAGSVEEAIRRLERAAKERLGVDLRNWQPARGGRWGQLSSRKQELESELERSERERAEISALAHELAELDEQRERLVASVAEARRRNLALRLRYATARLERARELEQKAAARPQRPVVLKSELPAAVAGLAADLRNAERECAEATRRAEAERARGERLQTELEQLERELASLAPGGVPNAAGQERIRALAARVEARRAEIAELESGREGADALRLRAAALRAARDRLRDLERSLQSASRAWLAGAVGAAAGAVVLVATVGVGAAVAALVLAAALVAVALARRGQARRALAKTLAEAGVENAIALEDQLVRAEAQLDAHTRTAQLLASEERELAECLDAHGAPASGDLLARAEAYARALELAERSERLRAELERLQEVAAEAARAQKRLAEAQAALRQTLASVGIEQHDLHEALRGFEQLREAAERDARALHDADRAAEALRALTRGRPLAELEHEREELARALAEHATSTEMQLASPSGASDGDGRPAEALADLELRVDAADRQLAQLESQLAELERRRHGLEREIQTRERQLSDPAELRATIAEIDEECRMIELQRDAVRLAIEELRAAAAAAHRQFAPRLNEELGRLLPRITGGRYRRALVAEDLAVSVEAPETGSLVSAELLSRGTRDQIYLVERLAIARLLDEQAASRNAHSGQRSGRAPLLLDDPFDRFDALRLRAGLEQLVEESRERQVVLFAEERSHVAALCELDSDCQVIELPAPSSQALERAGEGSR
ncbi:AAA family ATPase [Thermoleophilum album]|uniref:Uncharacterized protein YhaN n=1 Tax=Thermoleophilum album TaxID=29539 RepID=A0A1H6FKR4_THEAL|nr:AAA family ATPase [Thermoleophilum album]SEH10415.1 Uncharacterized protein YhaN [Thermoleophilum album]